MKNKKLLIGLAAVLLIGGATGAYFLLFGSNAADEDAPPEPAALVELAPFLTNIADQHKARIEVALAVAPLGLSEVIAADPLLVARLPTRQSRRQRRFVVGSRSRSAGLGDRCATGQDPAPSAGIWTSGGSGSSTTSGLVIFFAVVDSTSWVSA